MAGYPTIPTRAAFGPTRVDDGISPSDPNYLAALHLNLLLWQIAGGGIVLPRAYLLCSFASGVLTIEEHGETWAPNGSGSPPGVNKAGTGSWEFEYASSYPNEKAVSVPTELRFAKPVRQSDDFDDLVVCQINADKRTVELYVGTRSAGAAVDPADDDKILIHVY